MILCRLDLFSSRVQQRTHTHTHVLNFTNVMCRVVPVNPRNVRKNDDSDSESVKDPSSVFKLAMCEDMSIPSLGRERAVDQSTDLVVSDQHKIKKQSKKNCGAFEISSIECTPRKYFPRHFQKRTSI